jgi:outer membrane lipoprotein-sorting protein
MNTMKIAVQTLLSMLLFSSMAQAQENELGWTMDSAVKQLDRQGSDMSTVLAEVEIAYTGSDENLGAVKSGRIYLNDDGAFRIKAREPAGVIVLLSGRTVSYYNEGLARVDEYSLSKHKDRLEPFMPLGFSTTGRDLEKDYLVTFIGEDQMGGRRVLGLELTPKSDELRAMVSKMQIWFDQASWLPARQIISHTSGTETLTINYSGTARNLNLNPDLFRADWPRGTQEVRK